MTTETRGPEGRGPEGPSRPTHSGGSTETKAAYQTTELIAFALAVVGVLIAAVVVDEADAGGMGARQAWLYVTILTVGYMVSRGLAKSGSRDPHSGDHGDGARR